MGWREPLDVCGGIRKSDLLDRRVLLGDKG